MSFDGLMQDDSGIDSGKMDNGASEYSLSLVVKCEMSKFLITAHNPLFRHTHLDKVILYRCQQRTRFSGT